MHAQLTVMHATNTHSDGHRPPQTSCDDDEVSESDPGRVLGKVLSRLQSLGKNGEDGWERIEEGEREREQDEKQR